MAERADWGSCRNGALIDEKVYFCILADYCTNHFVICLASYTLEDDQLDN